MRERKQGPCRVCGRAGRNNLHHLIPRSFGLAAWSEANLAPLCGSGTSGCHGLVEIRDAWACRRLAESLSDAEYAYVVEHYGEGFFERRLGVVYARV